MAASNHSHDIITTLPNEILCRVLNLCRSDGFESAILACKRFHHAAQHLIVEHNLCKRYLSTLILKSDITGHVALHSAFDFLEGLLILPSNIQVDQFCYFKRIILHNNYYDLRRRPSQDFFSRMRTDAPRLHDTIGCIVHEMWTWHIEESEDQENRDFDVEVAGYCSGSSPHLGFWPFLYQIAILSASNVESLVLSSVIWINLA